MGDLSNKTVKRKKVLRKAGFIFLITILFMTFFSKTINNLLLPEVECSYPIGGKMVRTIEVSGEVKALNTEKIYSYGNVEIIEVRVQNGNRVSKGDVLALVDETDAMAGLKSSELEVLALENELKNYKNSFEAIDITLYEKAAAMAFKQMQDREENLKAIKTLYEQGAESYKSLKDAESSAQFARDDYAEKLVLIEKMNIEKADKEDEFKRTVSHMSLVLEVKKEELDSLKKKVPGNGEIISAVDGTVNTVTVEEGFMANSGQLLFEIVKKETKFTVKWKLDVLKAESFDEGDKVTINFKTSDGIEIEDIVDRKVLLPLEGIYEFSSNIDTEGLKPEDGQSVDVSISKETGNYEVVVPKSSIIKGSTGDYIFVLKERKGSLGDELYVEEAMIQVLDSDDLNSAIKPTADISKEKVVSYSSKMLMNGTQVKLR